MSFRYPFGILQFDSCIILELLFVNAVYEPENFGRGSAFICSVWCLCQTFDFSQGECENGEFSQWICVSPIQLYTAECHLLPCPCDIMVESLEERVFVGMKILEDAGSTG